MVFKPIGEAYKNDGNGGGYKHGYGGGLDRGYGYGRRIRLMEFKIGVL